MSGETKQSVTREAPDITVQPAVDFNKQDYEVLIEQKGTDVLLEQAVKCPCRSDSTGAHQPLSDCQNCAGSGWLFINRTRTKMVLSSMNNQTKYSQWSQEKIGMVAISARDVENLGEMDRITVLKGESQFTETIHPKLIENELFAFTSYDLIKVTHVFLFKSSKDKLVKLNEGVDFEIRTNKIILNKRFKKQLADQFNVSLRYTHRPVYHILDLTRDVMLTDISVQFQGDRETVKMPIHAIGRRAHYIPDFDNLEGPRTFDNSTIDYSE